VARHELKQDVGRLRMGEYVDAREQLGAFAKILEAILPHLSPEARAAIPADALAVLDGIAAVKARFPKNPKKKGSR